MNINWKYIESPIEYQKGITILKDIVEKTISDHNEQTIILLEYQDVYTKGLSPLNPDEILNKKIKIIESERGGKLTYHGPGQRIIYPVLHLYYFNYDIRKYINFLHQWIIETLSEIGIKADKDSLGIGIWVTKDNLKYKIASIGIKIKKWVSSYGIGVNIFTDLSKFNNITPCGLKNNKITSIAELKDNINYKDFDIILKNKFYQLIQDFQ